MCCSPCTQATGAHRPFSTGWAARVASVQARDDRRRGNPWHVCYDRGCAGRCNAAGDRRPSAPEDTFLNQNVPGRVPWIMLRNKTSHPGALHWDIPHPSGQPFPLPLRSPHNRSEHTIFVRHTHLHPVLTPLAVKAGPRLSAVPVIYQHRSPHLRTPRELRSSNAFEHRSHTPSMASRMSAVATSTCSAVTT